MDADDPTYSSLGFIGSINDPGYFGKTYNLRNLMYLMNDAHPDKPIWITEIGFFVGSTNPAAASASAQSALLIDTVSYAWNNFTTSPYLSRTYSANVQKMFWFNYQDYGDESLPGTWGLRDLSGNKRTSYDTFKNLIQQYLAPK
jgi:hypothetical protein